MTENRNNIDIVGQTIQDLLPVVNAGFNWDIIERLYDDQPVGTAMSLHFTDESGENSIEDLYLAIEEGPSVALVPTVTEEHDYIGAVIMYQDYGLRMLDPDDPMTPDRARYHHRGVTIQAAEGKSRERTWMVISNVLEVMLESVIYKQQQPAAGGDIA
jgi:hypothetical protein